MRQHSNLNEILVFMAVADGGSFVAGARALGLTGSAASKAIGRLEDRLAVRLFHRTTRSISLTDEGRIFYDNGLRVLEALESAEASVGRGDGAPRGTLRLTAPDAFGRKVLMPIVHSFIQQWSEVRVDVNLTDRPVELVQEGFDLAFRIGGASAGDGLISRVVTSYSAALCGSPSYFAKRIAPQHPDELSRHECLLFRSADKTQNWRYRDANGDWLKLPTSGRLCMDSGEGLYEAAVAGHGIALLPGFLVDRALAEGALLQVLADLDLGRAEIVALYPSKQHLEPRVRRFIDLVAEMLGKDRGD